MRPPIISCDEFMSFYIVQITYQFMIIVVSDYLLSKSG